MSQIEIELRTVCKVKADKYEQRQDYLAALCKSVSDKLTEDQFKALSDEAFDWYEQARQAHDKGTELPEFPDYEPLPEPDTSDIPEAGEEFFEKAALVKPKKSKTGHPRYDAITGEKDKFGITKGTKTSDAMAMFEKGCTMGAVTAALGGKYYNALDKLAKEGHMVEKLESGGFKVTHKDEVPK